MASDDAYDLLYSLLDDCMNHFRKDDSTTGKSFVHSLGSIHNNAVNIRPIAIGLVAKVAHKYDACPEVKANGYRSLLALLESLMLLIIGNLQTICKERRNVFFRANRHNDKLRCLAQILHQMRALFYYAQKMIGCSENGWIFVDEKESDDIMHDCEILAKSCFYSHVQGFQFYQGIQPIIQALSMFTASYNDICQHSGVWKSTKSLFNSGKYVVSPSVRGKKMEKIYSEAGVKFFKAFFSLPEQGIGVMLPSLMGELVRVNRVFSLIPKEFELQTRDGDKIPIRRTSFTGDPCNIRARLISAELREGQDSPDSPSLPDSGLDKSKVSLTRAKKQNKSNTLIFFCHGGGFISQSTKSYEVVLREWSKQLSCPIFSIDYSLSPDAPFPEAFDECFYSYAWALKNAHFLGTTAQRVIFVGDSAGGNLILSVAMRAAAYNIQVPDSILAMYPSCVVRLCGSPSRLLAVMDPILPHCMLTSCLCAYTGFRTENVAYNTKNQCTHSESNHHCHLLESPSKSDDLQSPSRQSVADNSVISTFVQDVGEGLGRLATATTSSSSEPENWWDEELFTYESEYKPEVPSQPSTLSRLFKAVGEKFSNVLSLHANENPKTYWDEEFDIVDIEDDENVDQDILQNAETSSEISPDQGPNLKILVTDNNGNPGEPEAHFKIKLPHGFTPLKSKFFGERVLVHHTSLVKNPYISPALAPDDMLLTLPHVDVVGCELDPLFDDSIALSKRLHGIGKEHKLHIVRGLPHGFLSLQMCKETKEASKMCLQILKDRIQSFGDVS